ncbi:MAG: tRNA (adenosine(37)-N6)-threonylcarbamoyltransferase complex dimerization subunit type 1 TsaB [Myxococcales bacterium]|nr:tRNA (adenosine(37)-N6)-threonylcarbamoyltransferase complex dimerization subunit type 1 TsaB [Myxococcales bacterium]
MTLLCIDTSSSFASLVVAREGRLLAALGVEARHRHAETLLGRIEELLSRAGVDKRALERVGVTVGPGGFTAVRVGLATAKGLALGLDIPVVGVGSLRVLARGMPVGSEVLRLAVRNAYRGEVFAAAYRSTPSGALEEVLAPFHAAPEQAGRAALDVATRGDAGAAQIAVAGEGVLAHGPALWATLGEARVPVPPGFDVPSPAALVVEVEERWRARGPVDLSEVEPLYVRASDATLPASAPGM